MKCSIKNNFCQVSRLVIYSEQFDLHLSDVSLSAELLKGCEDSDESHEITHISLASIAEMFLPQITDSLLEATDHIDVLIDRNQGLFWSMIKREWFFSNLRELNILKVRILIGLSSIYRRSFSYDRLYWLTIAWPHSTVQKRITNL